MPVSVLRATTLALGITAPVGSDTVPEILPVTLAHRAGALETHIRMANNVAINLSKSAHERRIDIVRT
jgi:hypothetical protein